MVLAIIPVTYGVAGYIAPIVVVTFGYAVFQTANNTVIMKEVRQDQRGVVSGMLNLSRNLGVITGASVLGAVFALAAGTSDVAAVGPADVASGMRTTFAVAAMLIVVALIVAMKSQPRGTRAGGVRQSGGHADTEDDTSRTGAHNGKDTSTLPADVPGGAGRVSSAERC